ncbi:MAG: ATP synthase subunit I, partial [Burkholderiales bacterium]|nr:ATP synthase subunit I [Burkholderiales bacterium]
YRLYWAIVSTNISANILEIMLYSRPMDYKNLRFVFGQRAVKLQIGLSLICVVVTAIIAKNLNSIISAAVGGGLAIIPTLLYAYIVFRKGLINYPATTLRLHQMAMAVRFIANFVLFVIVCLNYKQLDFLILFVTYLVTLSAYWLSLIKK